jgi:tetratricopeptide (TPR) repeat protein
MAAIALAADDPQTLIRRAVEAQQAADYQTAAENYRAALRIRPDDVATHVNLGVVLVKLAQFDEAIREYRAAEKLLPGDPRIALNLALAYEKSGRVSQAAEQFEAMHSASPQDKKIAILLADCDLQLGQDTRVIELLRPLEAEDSADPAVAYMLGMAFLHQHNLQNGQMYLDKILRRGDTAEARFLLGARMFESGDYPAAANELAAAIELNPHLPELQSYYGQALLNTGILTQLSQHFKKSYKPDRLPRQSRVGSDPCRAQEISRGATAAAASVANPSGFEHGQAGAGGLPGWF